MHHVSHGPHGVIQALCQVGVFRGWPYATSKLNETPKPPTRHPWELLLRRLVDLDRQRFSVGEFDRIADIHALELFGA